MRTIFWMSAAFLASSPAAAQVRTGAAAMGDWRQDAPGVVRHILPDNLPSAPTPGHAAVPAVVARPTGAAPMVPAGFRVSEFARLDHPRQIRAAPNGDVFVSETDSGRVRLLRAPPGASAATTVTTFAEGLDRPFGIAFWPTGSNPRWVYVAENNRVVRFPYPIAAQTAPRPEVVVGKISASSAWHTTRDLAFSADGGTLFVSVGSGSNVGEGMARKSSDDAKTWAASNPLGAAWGNEAERADVLVFNPDGSGRRIFATGIRNCVSMAVQPRSGTLWCAVNERDMLGDNLPPDYVSSVQAGGFYGWPWYFIGNHEDSRRKGERPDLAGKAIVPDVLIQAHSAPVGMTFYSAHGGVAAFPAAYRGDAFVGLHGSWNRGQRTGYKIVRVIMRGGKPTGDYQDFMTGFVVDDKGVWGRPVGVTEGADGALLAADDGSGIIWRIAPSGAAK